MGKERVCTIEDKIRQAEIHLMELKAIKYIKDLKKGKIP